MILDKNSAIQELKQLNKNYLADEHFRNAFASSSLSRQQALSTLDYDYSSAINQAYIASMENANAIAGSALGQGYKQQALNDNQSALLDAFNQYKQNYLSNQQNILQNYDELNQSIYNSYANQEERISNQAETLVDYSNAHYDYLDYLYKNGYMSAFDTADFNKFLYDDGTLKNKSDIFNRNAVEVINPETGETEVVEEGFFDGEGNITDIGRDYLDYIENAQFEGVPTFSEYLYNERKDLYDWAETVSGEYGSRGFDLFRTATGRDNWVGKNPTSKDNLVGNNTTSKDDWVGKNPSEYHYKIADAANKWTDDYVYLTNDNLITTDYFGKDALKLLESDNWKLTDNSADIYTPELFYKSAKTLTDGQAGTVKKRTIEIKESAEAAMKGELQNGTIIDINRGGGAELWAYWNGKFYKMEAQGPYDIVKLPADYGTQQDRNYEYYKKGNNYYKRYDHWTGAQLPTKSVKIEKVTEEEYNKMLEKYGVK
jgi:hypothetical protein